MRSVFTAAFLAHLFLSTTCMTLVTPVQAQESVMMSAVSGEQTENCHHDEQDRKSSQAPDASCLHHCLSQATNRTVSDGNVTDHAAPALPAFLALDLPAMTASAAPDLGADFHPSPPPLSTVVLLQ